MGGMRARNHSRILDRRVACFGYFLYNTVVIKARSNFNHFFDMQSEKPSFASFAGGARFVSPRSPQSQPVTANAHTSEPRMADSADGGKRGQKTAAMFDGIITVCLAAMFFGIPIFFTGVTFQGITFEKQIYFYLWLLVGIVSWVSRGVILGEMRIRRTPIDIPVGLFWLFYVLSSFFSVDRWHSFWGFFGDPSRGVISVTALVLAYYFLMSHFTVKRFRWMFASFLVTSFFLVVWSFLVVMNIHFLPTAWEMYAPMSLIGTVSTLTIFLGFLVPLFLTALFSLWESENMQSLRKGVRTTLTTLLFIGLTLTMFLLLALYAFVPWIAVLGGLSFFMVYILAQIVRPTERFTWVPMLVFVLMLGFLMIGSNGLSRATLPVEVTPNADLSWQIAKETLKEHFFVGVGPANYEYAFSMFRPQKYNLDQLYTLRFYQGTGLFFESLPTLGVVGTVLLLILGFSFLSVGLYLLSYEKQKNKIYSLGFWTAALIFFIAGFTSAINGSLLILGVLLSALALAVLLWESGSEERYLNLSFKAAPKFALALAFIFMVVSAGVAFLFAFMGKVFVADVTAGRAVRMSVKQPSLDAANLLVRAIQNYPQEGRYYTRLGQEFMSLANMEAGKDASSRDVNAVATYVRQAVAASEQGKQLMPNDVLATESLALVYENGSLYASDALVKAEEIYTRAHELEPHNPLYDLKLGQVKKSNGDAKPAGADRDALYNEAKDLFQKAIYEKNNLAVAYYNMAVVLSLLKDTDKAIENTVTAVRLDNSNLNYRYNLGVLYQFRNKEGDQTIAENLYKDILTANDKLIDVRLSLGLLYEKQGKKDAAVAEYQKIVDLLPADSTGNVKQTRDQVVKFIDNVHSGVSNLAKKPADVAPATEATPTVPEGAAAPIGPNTTPISGGGQ